MYLLPQEHKDFAIDKYNKHFVDKHQSSWYVNNRKQLLRESLLTEWKVSKSLNKFLYTNSS